MTTAVAIPEAVKQEIASVNAFAGGQVARITSAALYQEAGLTLRDIVTRRKVLESRRLEITRPMDEAKKSVMALFAAPLDALSTFERNLRSEVNRYDQEERRKREEEQRRLEAKAEAERREREAIAAEHRRKAQEAETEAARARYEALAEAQEEKASYIAAPVVPDAPAAEGIGGRENWSAEVTDLRELVNAVAAGTVPLECVVADMKVLNGMARALKRGFNVAGCKAVCERGLVVKGV